MNTLNDRRSGRESDNRWREGTINITQTATTSAADDRHLKVVTELMFEGKNEQETVECEEIDEDDIQIVLGISEHEMIIAELVDELILNAAAAAA